MFYYKLTYSVNPYFLGVLSNKIVLNAEVSYTRFKSKVQGCFEMMAIIVKMYY